MKSNALKVFQMQVVDAPELLVDALNYDFFKKVNMQRIPVEIKTLTTGEIGGFCDAAEYTQENEIVIEADWFEKCTEKKRARRIEGIQSTYLHECAHRLTNLRHFGGFLAVNMLLHMRAGLINKVNIYDMHEEKHISKVFEFAFLLSTELTNSDLTAEACSEIILQKYTVWLDEMNRAPALEAERIEQAEARKQAAAERRTKEAHAISNQIANLRQDRWLFGLGFSILTFILTYHFLT